MFPDDMVTIRFDVQAARLRMIQAVNAHAGELAKLIEAEFDRVLATFDWKNEVANIASEVLREAVRKQLESAVRSLQWDDALRQGLVKEVLGILARRTPHEGRRLGGDCPVCGAAPGEYCR